MLTGDQNLVDLSYLVRWNIKDLKLFRFQLAEPEGTVREVAEAAMRASVAEDRSTRCDGCGPRRHRAERARADAGDPRRLSLGRRDPGRTRSRRPIRRKVVDEAFKDVSAAQQDADARSTGPRPRHSSYRARAG